MTNITISGLNKTYDQEFMALKDMNLEVPDGEFVVFVGPSGCGKSTALRMIAGLEDITSGQVHIGSQVVNDLPPRDRDIAMVFQNYALYPHMNVRENMGFALKLNKTDKSEINRKVEEAAKILGIEGFLDRKPKALSGGQRQRVALGRAIVREPKAFLMDEPLSNLDAKLRVNMRTEIAKLHNRLATTTIYVTHDQTEAMTMADRIVVLKDGVVQQVASPQEMYERPENIFVAGFIGSPAMNFMRAYLKRDHEAVSGYVAVFGERAKPTHVPLPRQTVSEHPQIKEYAGSDVIMGIRPEHMEDASLSGTGSTSKSKGILEVEPEVLESMGSEKYVYFSLTGAEMASCETPARASDDSDSSNENGYVSESSLRVSDGGVLHESEDLLVARLSAESRVSKGQALKLSVDPAKVRLFDLDSHRNIL